MKTKNEVLICKLDFDNRDILRPVRNYDIAYAEWCKDNNMLPGFNTFKKFNERLSKKMCNKKRNPSGLINAISKFCCLCTNAFISWCAINEEKPSEENWDTFVSTVLDIIDGIYQGIEMLEQKEATDVCLLVTAGEGYWFQDGIAL